MESESSTGPGSSVCRLMAVARRRLSVADGCRHMRSGKASKDDTRALKEYLATLGRGNPEAATTKEGRRAFLDQRVQRADNGLRPDPAGSPRK